MNDFERMANFVDTQNALARLTPEELATLDVELQWVQKQRAAGRIPSPEKLVAKAPLYLRVLTWIDDD